MGKIVLLFITVILIGYHFDNSDKLTIYQNLYNQSVIENKKANLSNKLLGYINEDKSKEINYLRNKLKTSEDSVKFYKKYKKLYSHTFKKDSVSLLNDQVIK